jgi:hypothetical protein
MRSRAVDDDQDAAAQRIVRQSVDREHRLGEAMVPIPLETDWFDG